MKSIQISHRKLVAILHKEAAGDPIAKVMVSRAILPSVKRGEERLLSTGAKLLYDNGKYYLSGYAADGSDVDKFFK